MSNEKEADAAHQAHMARLQMQMAQQQNSLAQVVAAGHQEYGDEFDTMSADVVNHIGADQMNEFNSALTATDNPVALIEYLSRNPDEAKSIAKMSAARKAVAMERIQARLRPDLAFQTPSATPSWKKNAGDRGSLMDDSISDDQWFARYKRKYGVR